jgi:hypothetical protein
LRECQECAKLSRQRVAALKNLKYTFRFFLTRFFGYLQMCYFIVLISLLLFYNVEHFWNKEPLEWGCPNFDWYFLNSFSSVYPK